jgi:superfamily II RNA helicase
MSGRAGRRGMDPLGHVVVVADPFRPAWEAAALAMAPPDPLISRFTPTYGMVLSLLNRFTPGEAEALLRKSFGQYQADQHGRPAGDDRSGRDGRDGRGRGKGDRPRRRGRRGHDEEERSPRSLYWQRFQALQQVLEHYDYLYNDKPTDSGILAASLRVENELFVSEVLLSDVWEPLNAPQFAGLVAALTTDELRPDVRVSARPGKKLAIALDRVRPMARSLRNAQMRYRVEVPVKMVEIPCGLVQLWADGASWDAVTDAAEMDEGDIVYLFRRALDLLRQIPDAPGIAPKLAKMAADAARAIDREPVNQVL